MVNRKEWHDVVAAATKQFRDSRAAAAGPVPDDNIKAEVTKNQAAKNTRSYAIIAN